MVSVTKGDGITGSTSTFTFTAPPVVSELVLAGCPERTSVAASPSGSSSYKTTARMANSFETSVTLDPSMVNGKLAGQKNFTNQSLPLMGARLSPTEVQGVIPSLHVPRGFAQAKEALTQSHLKLLQSIKRYESLITTLKPETAINSPNLTVRGRTGPTGSAQGRHN